MANTKSMSAITITAVSSCAILFSSLASPVTRGTVIYVGHLLSKERMILSTLGLEEIKINILEPNLAGVITLVKSTNSSNLVQIGFQTAPPRVSEI